MNVQLKSLLRIGLSIFLAAFFLYLAFRGSDFNKLRYALKGANYLWASLLIPCLMISHLFRAWRWKYLLGPIKQDVCFRNLFSSLMIGYMVNNVLPRVGEIVRPYNLRKLERISMSAALGTVLVERIIDVFSFLLALAVIFIFYESSLEQVFPWLEKAGIIAAVATITSIGLFGLLLARREQLSEWLRKPTHHLPASYREKMIRLLHSFLDGFLIIKEPRQYVMITALSIVIWIWYGLMAYFPFHAFGMVEQYSLDFSAAAVTVVISSIGIIIPAPGGTGSYHWIARETLVRMFGVDVETALSYATVTHLLGFVSVILVGLFYFLRDNLKFSDALQTRVLEDGEIELVPEDKLSVEPQSAKRREL